MMLLFFALPPITAYYEPIMSDVAFIPYDEDDELIALLAYFEYFE
jgi:hypothetical protein